MLDLIPLSTGTNTTLLESLALKSHAGELCLEKPIYKESNRNSSYSLTVSRNTCELKYGKNCIGRFEDNDIVVDHTYVSRRHCCVVVYSNEQMEIFDTASKNGTTVNSQKIMQCWLKPQDKIILADVYMLISSSNKI